MDFNETSIKARCLGQVTSFKSYANTGIKCPKQLDIVLELEEYSSATCCPCRRGDIEWWCAGVRPVSADAWAGEGRGDVLDWGGTKAGAAVTSTTGQWSCGHPKKT